MQKDRPTTQIPVRSKFSIAEPIDVIGKKVLNATPYQGSYGQGGPGFLGLLLDNNQWLIAAIWGSSNWFHLNGVTDFSPEDLKVVIGYTIERFEVFENHMRMRIGPHIIELLDDHTTRSIFPGTKEPRVVDSDLREKTFLLCPKDEDILV